MKLLWYIPRLNVGGAESLSISILNQLSKSNSIILVTDTKNSSLIKHINSSIKIINLSDRSNFFYIFKLIKLRMIVLKNNDYSFVSNLTHANLNFYISLLFTKIRFVAIEHNTLSKYLSHKKNIKNIIINALCKFFYKKIHKIITVSNYVKKDLINNYGCKNCTTIHNAIDIKNIKLKSDLFKFKKTKPYIIFVGRIEKQKNLIKLLNIYHKLLANGVCHNLMIVGSGSDFTNLKIKIKKLDLDKKVILLGEKKNPFPYIKNADLSIMTSKFEGFGIFLIESLSLGVKIFTFDKKIVPEITNNKKFIKIFTASDIDSANVNKIKFLLKTHINKKNLKKLIIPYDTKIVSKKYIELICS